MGTGDPSASSGPDRAAATAATPPQDFADLAALNAALAASEPGVTGSRKAVPGEGRRAPPSPSSANSPETRKTSRDAPSWARRDGFSTAPCARPGFRGGKVYVTNAVKHFKFEPRGKRRIHRKPTAGEVAHYRWWLDRELELVHPAIVVALGATAVLALSGRAVPVTRARGPAAFDGRAGYITVHPSYLLRIPDPVAREKAYGAFVADLKQIRSLSRKTSVKAAT